MSAQPDEKDREAIRHDLGTSLLVEASAGTGKTHELVLRMVNLVGDAGVPAGRMAAVTFTRRATAELRQRFQIGLEEAIRQVTDPVRGERLRTSLGEIDTCFIGTIHAFCGELLRERPVEAGLAPGFREVPDDDPELVELRDRVWREEIERLERPEGQTQLAELLELGVEPGDLKTAYEVLCRFPEVEFPCEPAGEAGPLVAAVCAAAGEAAEFLDHALASLADAAQVKTVRDAFTEIRRSFDSTGAGDPLAAAEALGVFERKVKEEGGNTGRETAGRRWKEEAWEIRQKVVLPALSAWRRFLYPKLVAVAALAEAEFRRRRQKRGLIGFTDLLRLARDLLRDVPEVRADLAGRFSRILVDEFQDTDPLQAEFLLYLTGEDVREKDWRELRPRPGALFVVGDPKQAIYRFRRADLAAYAEFKRVFLRAGREVRLSASHRSGSAICDFVNRSFEAVFVGEGDERQAGAARLLPASGSPRAGGVERLTVETAGGERQLAAAAGHAEKAADWVAAELAGGRKPPDFLFLASTRSRLGVYQKALEKQGIPAVILTGSEKTRPEEMMSGLPGFASLLEAAAAPTEPLPAVAFLRSALCGASDEDLLRFRDAGGRFEAFATPPPAAGERVAGGLRLLRECVRDAETLPPAAAVARLAERSGLFACAAAEAEAESACATAARVLTLARRLSAEGRPFREVAGELAAVILEARVSATSLSSDEGAVRLMTIHSAKGLQAEVVLLVDPAGDDELDEPVLHIERSIPPRGYLEVARYRGSGERKVRTVLARPPEWDRMAEEERRASEAEIARRRYVAATRARDRLIVGINLHSTKTRPTPEPRGQWAPFQPFLEQDLPASEPAGPPGSRSGADLAAELGAAREGIAGRTGLLRRESYWLGPVTEEAAKLAAPAVLGRVAEGRGPAFGRVMHRILEAVMRRGGVNMPSLAATLLDAEDLPSSLLEDVIRLVEGVRASELWKRARAADECLVEVPFDAPTDDKGMPGVRRGAMDLVFREGDHWSIVDYKSDRVTAAGVEALVERYRGQVETYRREWEKFSRKPTRAGLYFLDLGDVRWLK